MRGDIVLSARLTRLHGADVTFPLTKHWANQRVVLQTTQSAWSAKCSSDDKMKNCGYFAKKQKLLHSLVSDTQEKNRHLSKPSASPLCFLLHIKGKTVLSTSVARQGFLKITQRPSNALGASRSCPSVLALMGAGCRVCTSVWRGGVIQFPWLIFCFFPTSVLKSFGLTPSLRGTRRSPKATAGWDTGRSPVSKHLAE